MTVDSEAIAVSARGNIYAPDAAGLVAAAHEFAAAFAPGLEVADLQIGDASDTTGTAGPSRWGAPVTVTAYVPGSPAE